MLLATPNALLVKKIVFCVTYSNSFTNFGSYELHHVVKTFKMLDHDLLPFAAHIRSGVKSQWNFRILAFFWFQLLGLTSWIAYLFSDASSSYVRCSQVDSWVRGGFCKPQSAQPMYFQSKLGLHSNTRSHPRVIPIYSDYSWYSPSKSTWLC